MEISVDISCRRVTRDCYQPVVSHSSCHSQLPGRFPNNLSEVQNRSEFILRLSFPRCVIIVQFFVVPQIYDVIAAQTVWSVLSIIAQPLRMRHVIQVLALIFGPRGRIVLKFISGGKVVGPVLRSTCQLR